jgi:undecaprenyl-diphosphatase
MTWEFDVLYALQGIHNPVLDKIMVAVSLLGNAGILWIVIGIILLIPQKYRKLGIEMLVSLAVAHVIGNVILKNLVARDRPCWIDPTVPLLLTNPSDYSFPSGHSMIAFAGSVILLLNDKRIGIPAVLLAVVIAFSRLYNFVHFPTDVLAGILIGTVIALLVDRLFVARGWKASTL